MAAILLCLMEVERSKLFKYLNLKKKTTGKRPDTCQHGFEYIYITAKILRDFGNYQDSTDLIKHLTYPVQPKPTEPKPNI